MDYLLFSSVVVLAFVGLHLWKRRSGWELGIPWVLWTMVLALLVLGWIATDNAEGTALQHIQQMVEGFPPTYAQEFERMGHAQLNPETDPNDPRYLAMIDAEIRWEKVNPSISDIYTMRKLPDGRNVFIVDSETDYDRNGAYVEDREQRTAIGEVYEKQIPALERAFAGTPAFMDETYSDRWGDWVSAFIPMHDAQGRTEGVLGVDYPAASWIAASRQARWTAMGIVLVLLIFIGASSMIIDLLRADLRNRKIAEERVSQMNIELEKRVVDRTAELQTAHQKLVETSRQAGMAEVATSVLHNVGNVFNSVNVSCSLITEKLRNSRIEHVPKMAEMLRKNAGHLAEFLEKDPSGQKLPDFLAKLGERLTEDQAAVLTELQSLIRNIEHIKEIVAVQQRHANISSMRETVPINTLVEDALRMNGLAESNGRFEVVREFNEVPPILLDKHKVLQILVNLIRNAKRALDDSDQSKQRMTLRIGREDEKQVAVSVTDNGIGIAPENLTRVFGHGFTTKKDGHGFGLHSGVLAAREMGGNLTVQSEGLGRGATFTLHLPLKTAGAN